MKSYKAQLAKVQPIIVAKDAIIEALKAENKALKVNSQRAVITVKSSIKSLFGIDIDEGLVNLDEVGLMIDNLKEQLDGTNRE